MTRRIFAATWDHPRIRGEHRALRERVTVYSGSSPHTRGALDEASLETRERGIIPAYAGSTHRGASMCTSASGSSPHTRGARLLTAPHDGAGGIIPAYAGSTRGGRSRPAHVRDHPRIRGEHRPVQSRPRG